MEIQVTQGQDIIKIVSDGFAGCLVVKQAKVVNWPDCMGSIGEYYAISTYPDEDRQQLTRELNEVLVNGSEAQILDSIKPFLNLFSNGRYQVSFGTLKQKTSVFHDGQMVYSDHVPEHEQFSGSFYPYPFENLNYFYTIPGQQIHPERVEFYTKLLKEGVRPRIMLFTSYNTNTCEDSADYILDGHHKLSAYLTSGLDIPFVGITKLETQTCPTQELLHMVQPLLKDFEFLHLLRNNDENVLKVDFLTDLILTKALDQLLLRYKNPGTGVVQVFLKYRESGEEGSVLWLKQRLKALSENPWIGKGLQLYYRGYDERYGNCWLLMDINNRKQLQQWTEQVLKLTWPEKGLMGWLKHFKLNSK